MINNHKDESINEALKLLLERVKRGEVKLPSDRLRDWKKFPHRIPALVLFGTTSEAALRICEARDSLMISQEMAAVLFGIRVERLRQWETELSCPHAWYVLALEKTVQVFERERALLHIAEKLRLLPPITMSSAPKELRDLLYEACSL